jgi:TRAP-type mannitol/chloroaromatic compound transport system substrate-binding protein
VSEFGFNQKAYEALPAYLRRILDLAVAATQVMGYLDFHTKNALALERLKTEFKGKVELVQFPLPVLRELKKIAGDVVRAQAEKSAMARRVHASFSKFQALAGPWDQVAQSVYYQLARP